MPKKSSTKQATPNHTPKPKKTNKNQLGFKIRPMQPTQFLPAAEGAKNERQAKIIARLQARILKDASFLLRLSLTPKERVQLKKAVDLRNMSVAPHPLDISAEPVSTEIGSLYYPYLSPKVILHDLVRVPELDGLDGIRALAAVARRLAIVLESSDYYDIRKSSDTWPILYSGEDGNQFSTKVKSLGISRCLPGVSLYRERAFALTSVRNIHLMMHLSPMLELYFSTPKKRAYLIYLYEVAFNRYAERFLIKKEPLKWWNLITVENFPAPSRESVKEWHLAFTAKLNLEYYKGLLRNGTEVFAEITGYSAISLEAIGIKGGTHSLSERQQEILHKKLTSMIFRRGNICKFNENEKIAAFKDAARGHAYTTGTNKAIRAEMKKALVAYFSGVIAGEYEKPKSSFYMKDLFSNSFPMDDNDVM